MTLETFSESKIAPLLNFGTCDELTYHGVTIPAYFKIKGPLQYCAKWRKPILFYFCFMVPSVCLFSLSIILLLLSFFLSFIYFQCL